MFSKKQRRHFVLVVSFLLLFSTVFSNIGFAAGKGEKTTTYQSKKDKIEKTANQKKLLAKTKDHALEKKAFSEESKKLAEMKAVTKNTKLRKSQLEKSSTIQQSKNKTSIKTSDVSTPDKASIQKTQKKAQKKKQQSKYASDQLIVKFKSTTEAKKLREKHSLKTNKKLNSIGAEVVNIPKGKNVQNLVKELKKDPSVEFVQPNYKYYTSSLPNDPYFSNLWGLNNDGTSGLEDIDIDYPEAIDTFKAGSIQENQVIAVIDTGIDINHPDLASNIWTNPNEIPNNGIDDDNNKYIDDVNGWDFYNRDNTIFDPLDFDDHGTHVAGTIAAVTNNSLGVSGIAPNVKIMPLKVFGPYGGLTSDAILAIEYASKMGVKIANNSWGGSENDLALKYAIDHTDMLFIAAAGNEWTNNDETPSYPANYDNPNVISVAALNRYGGLAWFSNYGENTVDIAAPGEFIQSTVPKKVELGASAEINNTNLNTKAIFNGFGFENIMSPDEQQTAFNKAVQYLGATSNSRILLVQDDESETGENYNYLSVYTNLLDSAGLIYDVRTVLTDLDGPSVSELSNYDIVIWFSGDAMGTLSTDTLTDNDISSLESYLNTQGKSLLLSGADLLFGNEYSSFVTDTLGLDIFAEGYAYASAQGVATTVYDGDQYQLDFVEYADYILINDNNLAKINLVYPGEQNYDNAYAYYDGTSMATPHVTGVAALLLGAKPSLNVTQIKDTLIASGDYLPSLNGKVSSGKTVNANNALNVNIEELDNDIPGVALDKDTVEGTLDSATDTDDVYSVHLDSGQSIKLTLSGDAGTDFDLYLFSPWTYTVNDSSEMLKYSENEGTSSETIEFTANYSGEYYIDVYAFEGAGAYSLTAAIGNGPGEYEDDSQTIMYYGDWTTKTGTSYSGNSIHQLNTYGELEFTFVGNEFEWIGLKDKNQGIADIYIDGEFMGSVSLYSDTLQTQQSLFKTTTSYGNHVININWTGKRDPKARKSGTAINVDKLVVTENLTPPAAPSNVQITYDGYVNAPVLSWDSNEAANFYKVYRKEIGQTDYTLLGSVSQPYYFDYAAQVGKTYEYVVSAVGIKELESVKSTTIVYTHDDQIPGILMSSNDVTGTIDEVNDYIDVWAVNLEAGKTYSFSFNGPQDTDFDYLLFDPSTTNIYEGTPVRELYGTNSEDYVTYPVEQTGTYYIVVESWKGAGEYSIKLNSKPTVQDDDIPGAVPLTTTTEVSDFLDSYDIDDVYSVDLAQGDTITLNLSSTATNGSDLDLYLYGPNSTTVDYSSTSYVPEVAYSNQMDTSTETITYVAEQAGKYYIDVNLSYGSGPYKLIVNKKSKDPVKTITTKIEDDNPEIKYSGNWNRDSTTSASGGNISYINELNASAEFSFSGTGIRWIALKHTSYGAVDVYIDGQKVDQINLYSSSTKWQQVVYENLNLSDGSHTIKLVNKGKRINLDAFEIIKNVPSEPTVSKIDDSDPNIQYSGTWNHDNNTTSASGGTISHTNVLNASIEFTFSGTGIRVIALKHYSYGEIDVYIDSQKVDQINLYSFSSQWQQVVYESLNLSNGAHTIKLVNKSKRINLDAFEVIN